MSGKMRSPLAPLDKGGIQQIKLDHPNSLEIKGKVVQK